MYQRDRRRKLEKSIQFIIFGAVVLTIIMSVVLYSLIKVLKEAKRFDQQTAISIEVIEDYLIQIPEKVADSIEAYTIVVTNSLTR